MTKRLKDLRTLTANAVRQARAELSKQFGRDKLFAFALCTDDDLMTLYHVACTRKWVRERNPKYSGIGFVYVEWEQCASETLFDPANELIRALANEVHKSDRARADARDRRFEAIVLALSDCRNEGIFDDDTLLCCGSTDPSNHLESLAMNAVDRLNLPVVADQFAEHLGYAYHRKTET